MVLCLTEKATQVKAFKEAGFMRFSKLDNFDLGVYNNEEYLFVPLSGHILNIDKEEVLKLVDVDNFIPPQEFYPIEKSDSKNAKYAQQNLSKITKKYLNQIDKVLIMTDPDREGALIGQEALTYYNILQNVNDVTYVDMNNTSANALKKAFDYAVDTGKDCMNWQDLAFLGRVISNLNFVGYITSYAVNNLYKDYSGFFYTLGTQQLRALHLLVERYKANRDADTRNHYRIKLHTSNGVFIVELDGDIDTADKNKIQQIANNFIGKNITITNVKNELLAKKSPKWYDGSQLGAEASKITKESIKDIFSSKTSLMQTMYEKGILTYIRAEAKGKMPIENFNEYVQIAKNLAEQYKIVIKPELQKKYLWRGANSKVKVNHTPTTLATQIDISKYNGAEKVILDLASKQILATFMDDLVNRVVNISGDIAGYRAVQNDSKTYCLGWGVLYGKKNEEFANKNIESIKEQDVLSVQNIELEEYKKPKPALYTEATLLQDLKKKKIGSESTYGSYIEILLDKNRGYAELNSKKQIIPTQKGIALAEVIPEDSREALKLFEDISDAFIDDRVTKDEVFAYMRKIAYKFYKDMKQTFKDNEEKLLKVCNSKLKSEAKSNVVKNLTDFRCPKCSHKLVDIKTAKSEFLACSNNEYKNGKSVGCNFVLYPKSTKFNTYTLSNEELAKLLEEHSIKKEVFDAKSSMLMSKTIKFSDDFSKLEVI